MNPLKDLHILYTPSNTWISPTTEGEGPTAREGHSATLVGKRLFIFGGTGKSFNDTEVYYNDLYILNTEIFVWNKAVTTGTPPSARDGHTCSSWKNKMIVIGGEDSHDYYLSDVYILDADTLMWKELKVSGLMLPPRAGHSTVAFGKILFVFGGFTAAQTLYNDLYMLDIDAGIWTRVATNGQGPSARFSMAGDSLDPLRSGVLFFIGGCNKTLEALDDIYYLHTGLVKQTEWKLEKLSLRKQLRLKCQLQSSALAVDRVGMGANTYHPVPISVYGHPAEPMQQGKKVFQARITNSISDAFTIETVIDGKPLRGIVLSNKPSNFQIPPTIHNPSRKRASMDKETVTSTYDNSISMSKAQRMEQQDSIDGKQREFVQQQEKDPTKPPLEAARTEAPIASPAVNITTSASAPDKVPAIQDTSANHVDTNKVELGSTAMRDDPTDDAPRKDDQRDDTDGAPLKSDDASREDDQMKDAMVVDDRTDGTDNSPTKNYQKKDVPIAGSPARDDQIDDTPRKDDQGEVRDNPPVTDEPMDDVPMKNAAAPMKDEKTDAAARNDDQTDDATMRGDETDDSPMKEDRTDDTPPMGDQTDTAPTRDGKKTVDDDDDDAPKEVNPQVPQENVTSMVGESVPSSATQDDNFRIADRVP